MVKILGLLFLIIFSSIGFSREKYIDIDYSKPSTEKRLTVKQGNKEIYRTWVAHGVNSGYSIHSKFFSNIPGSKQSSLGTMKIGQPYYGKHGLSYKLIGLDNTNSQVYNRVIVIHSANYIGYGRTGHSEGCLAVPEEDYKQFLTYINVGMIIKAHV